MTATQMLAPAPTRAGTPWPLAAAAPVLAGAAAVLWVVGLRPVDPAALDSLGVLPALSPLVILAYPVLIAAVVVELSLRQPRDRVLAVLTLFGVVAVYGLLPATEPAARMPVGWLHAGFAEYIAEHGDVLPRFDARFSWPGFFELVAMVTGANGYEQVTDLLQWAPLLLGGLAVLGVRALAVTVLGPGRASWFAPWVFLLANWSEQEYFSPQGTSYVVLLAGLVVVTRHLLHTPLLERPPARGFLAVPANRLRDRLYAQIVVLIMIVALAPTHQLTPFVFAAFLGVLWLTRRLWPGWLPAVALLVPAAWFAFGAEDFWSGRLGNLYAAIGDLDTSFQRNVGERLTGDVQHQIVVGGRLALTGFVVLLTAVALLLAHRRGHAVPALAWLAAVPFGMVAIQPYGGEILIRSYLFALPFLAVACGLLAERLVRSRRAVAIAVVWLVLSCIGLATVVLRGGNDSYVALTKDEVAVMEQAYDLAEPGERIYAVFNQWPLLSGRVGEVKQRAAMNHCLPERLVLDCVNELNPEFLFVGPAQDSYGQMFLRYPAGWTQTLVDELRAAGRYRLVLQQGAAMLAVRSDR